MITTIAAMAEEIALAYHFSVRWGRSASRTRKDDLLRAKDRSPLRQLDERLRPKVIDLARGLG
jgi:hypothetical protein